MTSYFSAQPPSSKPRRKYRSAFLTNLFQLLESEEYPDLIRWSKDGTQVELLRPNELAATVFPKLYKHSKLTSFIKQLSMYQFDRVYTLQKSVMVYYHPLFQKGRELKIERIQAAPKEKVSVKLETNQENSQDRKEQFLPFEPNKKIKTSSSISLTPKSSEEMMYWPELSLTHSIEQNPIFSEVSMEQSIFDFVISNENKEQMTRETSSFLDNSEYVFNPFTIEIASSSKGNIQGTNVTLFSKKLTNLFVNKLPAGFYEFQGILEKMLGFDQIDSNDTENLQKLRNNLKMYKYYSNL